MPRSAVYGSKTNVVGDHGAIAQTPPQTPACASSPFPTSQAAPSSSSNSSKRTGPQRIGA